MFGLTCIQLNFPNLFYFSGSSFIEWRVGHYHHTTLRLRQKSKLSQDRPARCNKLLENHPSIWLEDHRGLLFDRLMLPRQLQQSQPTIGSSSLLNIYNDQNDHQQRIINYNWMEKDEKGNVLDLILNTQHPIQDYQGLQNQYYQFGYVFLGKKQAVSDQYVYEKSLGAILTVMEKSAYEKEKIRDKVAALQLKHLHIDLKDSKDAKIRPFFKQAYQFIETAIQNKQNILIHCKGGMSRSPSILCSYIMKKYQLGYQQAYKILKERRSVVSINEGFQNELKQYEKEVKKK